MNEYIMEIPDYPAKIVKDGWNVRIEWEYKQHEEIVRCRDCTHYRFKDMSDIFHDECHNDSFCLRFVDGKRMEVYPNGFCAWGERREL